MRKNYLIMACFTILSMVLASCAGPGAASAPTSTIAPTSAPQATQVPAATSTSQVSATQAPTVSATQTITSTVTATQAVTPTVAPTQAITATQTTTSSLRTPEQAALDAAGGQKIGGSVTLLGPWGGAEQNALMAMLQPFETATGITVQYTGSKDESALLVTRVQAGNPPDVADFANPGQIAQFANQGKLQDLSQFMDMTTLKSEYSQAWLNLGTVNGKFVAMIIKAATKGLIWYDPKVWAAKGYQIPKTWNDMITLSQQIAATGATPWCVAMESGAASGWPGTDWLEDIILRQSGEQVYNQWWQGQIPWTSPQIKQAFQTWGTIVADPKMVYGGANSMLTTNYGDVGNGLFTNPPNCYMAHQASFITSFFTSNNKGVQPVTDFNFFPFPPFDATAPKSTEMAGDLLAMFNSTPQSQALIKYLATPEAQAIWASIGGGYLSPNQDVPLSVYPDQLSRNAAQVLTSAQVAVFDASDQMPQQMNAAFYKAVLNYIQTPSSLDSILQNLDTIQKTAYSSK
jgi:alpha-glucoside transport system substrate-binding protein